jgi:hypothetical protein
MGADGSISHRPACNGPFGEATSADALVGGGDWRAVLELFAKAAAGQPDHSGDGI